jgi:hypothetical protein
LVYGNDCIAKAQAANDIVRQRLKLAGCDPEHWLMELIGAGDGCPLTSSQHAPPEVMLRITARDARREVLARFTRELAPLITSGPAGLAGYAAGRPSVRPVYAYWPTLVPKQLLKPAIEVRTAQEWLA